MHGLVPGNLLLFGEYAVLEKGGLGISAAVKPLAKWDVGEGRNITGLYAGNTVQFDPETENPEQSDLFKYCLDSCSAYAAEQGRCLSRTGITVDSNLFFIGKRKTGFGSSAAAAAACVQAIMYSSFPEKKHTADFSDVIRKIAFRAHSAFQGKKGSGYDVYTSLSDGINLFCGGSNPVIKNIRLPWLGGLYFFLGEQEISTGSAVSAYNSWKENNPDAAGEFLDQSNSYVERLVSAREWKEAALLIEEYTKLLTGLGSKLNVPALVPETDIISSQQVRIKTSGAGNELYIVFSADKLDQNDIYTKIEIYHKQKEGQDG